MLLRREYSGVLCTAHGVAMTAPLCMVNTLSLSMVDLCSTSHDSCHGLQFVFKDWWWFHASFRESVIPSFLLAATFIHSTRFRWHYTPAVDCARGAPWLVFSFPCCTLETASRQEAWVGLEFASHIPWASALWDEPLGRRLRAVSSVILWIECVLTMVGLSMTLCYLGPSWMSQPHFLNCILGMGAMLLRCLVYFVYQLAGDMEFPN